MNSPRFLSVLSSLSLGCGVLSCASKGSDSSEQGQANTTVQSAKADTNDVQTDDAIRADMKKLEQRIETTAANLKRETAEGSRKLGAESKAKFESDMAALKSEYAALEARLSSGANTLGSKISNGTKTALNSIGSALKDLGDRIGSDPNAQPSSR